MLATRRLPTPVLAVVLASLTVLAVLTVCLAPVGPAHADARFVRASHPHAHAHSPQQAHVNRTVGVALHRGVYGAQPVLSFRGAADPSVLQWGGGYVGISTGPGAPRAVASSPGGPWTNVPSALLTLPTWALNSKAWASDIDYVGGTYVLYFSVPVAGLPTDGRCIGVATASDPTQTFVPDERPVVCPKQAVAPKALDRLKHKGHGLPVNGVIDPDMFTDHDGKRYLTYRTEGVPSTIRIVKLPRNGRAFGPTVSSTELVRSNGVIENPSLIVKHGTYVLFTSEGNFVGCSYSTTYRTSRDLLDFSASRPHDFLDTAKTGLCGPGGADVGVSPTGHPLLYFHAWTCPDLGGANCPAGPNYDATGAYGAQRSMFALALRWTSRQAPRIAGYVVPVAAPPVTPPPPPARAQHSKHHAHHQGSTHRTRRAVRRLARSVEGPGRRFVPAH